MNFSRGVFDERVVSPPCSLLFKSVLCQENMRRSKRLEQRLLALCVHFGKERDIVSFQKQRFGACLLTKFSMLVQLPYDSCTQTDRASGRLTDSLTVYIVLL